MEIDDTGIEDIAGWKTEERIKEERIETEDRGKEENRYNGGLKEEVLKGLKGLKEEVKGAHGLGKGVYGWYVLGRE